MALAASSPEMAAPGPSPHFSLSFPPRGALIRTALGYQRPHALGWPTAIRPPRHPPSLERRPRRPGAPPGRCVLPLPRHPETPGPHPGHPASPRAPGTRQLRGEARPIAVPAACAGEASRTPRSPAAAPPPPGSPPLRPSTASSSG